MFKIGHSYGEPENMTRQLNGEICEVRIWNVIRSQEEIYRNMYDVDPQTTGLKAYWKFNEGKGNIAKTIQKTAIDAKAYTKAIWPEDIEVTKKSKNNNYLKFST